VNNREKITLKLFEKVVIYPTISGKKTVEINQEEKSRATLEFVVDLKQILTKPIKKR